MLILGPAHSNPNAWVLAEKTVLIVYAHQSAGSFNAAVKDVALDVFSAPDYEVEVSDLYAMNFKAPATAEDIIGTHLKTQALACDYIGNNLLISLCLKVK